MSLDHLHNPECLKNATCQCAKCCNVYVCIFARRSSSIYRGMQSRFAAKKWKSGSREGTIRREKRNIPFTIDDFRSWLTVVLEDHPFCEYCGERVTIMDISPDHARPVSRNGSLGRENLRVCCDPCNRIKGELLVGEFKALMEGLKNFTEDGRNDVIKRLKGSILHFGNQKKEGPKATNILAIPAKKNKIMDPNF